MEQNKTFEQLKQEHEEFHERLKRDEEWWKNERAEDKKKSRQNILEHIKELEEELSKTQEQNEDTAQVKAHLEGVREELGR